MLKASDQHDPNERLPLSTDVFDADDSRDGANGSIMTGPREQGYSIVIDPHRLLAAIRAEANNLADMRGISQCVDYSIAAKTVYRQWKRGFERKAGQKLHKYDLMWLLAEEMNLALADAGIVDFARGEVLPQRLSRYLRDVARARVDA